jgi:acyl carrier protein
MTGESKMLEKLQEIIRRYSDDEQVVITGDMVLLSDLGLNSFELVELVCEVEEKFDVEIHDRDISRLKTVQDVMDYILAYG